MKNKPTDYQKIGEDSSRISANSLPTENRQASSHATTKTVTAAGTLKSAEDCPFRKLIDEWIDYCRSSGLSPKTLLDYSDKVYKFWWWWDKNHAANLGRHPKNVGIKEARSFAAYLRDPDKARWGITEHKNNRQVINLSVASIASYGRTVKVFFSWLETEKYIELSPFNKSVKFSSRHKEDKIIKTVDHEDLVKILKALTDEERHKTYWGCRNLAMLALLLDSGIRRGELLSIRLCDLDLEKGRCQVNGKTGYRWALFNEPCRAAIVDYLQKFRYAQEQKKFIKLPLAEVAARSKESKSLLWLTEDGEPLSYEGFGNIITRLSERSGVPFHAHKLRHTYATYLAQKGVSVYDLKELMGHKSVTTTQIYIAQNVDRLEEVFRPNSPLTDLIQDTNALPGFSRGRGRPRRQKTTQKGSGSGRKNPQYPE